MIIINLVCIYLILITNKKLLIWNNILFLYAESNLI